jgi:formylglycine-generating enzyme required for sulfatase activity
MLNRLTIRTLGEKMRAFQWSLILVFGLAVVGMAQRLDDVQLSGIVSGYFGTDTTVLSDATVVIENLGTGDRDSVITDAAGHWSWTGTSSSVGDHNSSVPGNLALAPSYPNPFSETTTIRILNNSQQRVRLDVYNILGQRVAELMDDNLRPGAFDLTWNGVNRNGTPLAQGMYFLCLNAGGHAMTQKMVVLGTGSGLTAMSLRGSNPGSGELFEPLRGTGSRGRANTLDDFSLRLEFWHAGYDSVVTSFTLPDGQDSVLVTYLRHHNLPPAGMVLVPAGPYSMGATYQTEAQPIHTVTVPAFYMDIYEVTNAQYKAFCDTTARAYPPDPEFPGMPNYLTDSAYANYPVVNVYWQDARDYAAWAGKRLPTEAEWERAAKGNTDNRRWPWGDDWTASYANIYENPADSFTYTSPVGNYVNGISPAGCYDMAGNVWEWCEDDGHDNYNDAPTDGSAWINTPRGDYRIGRGGSWSGSNTSTRCAQRDYNVPTIHHSAIGFRCAMSIVNRPPAIPSLPSPADSAIGQSVDVDLSWSGSDPDGDTLTYDVYFGTSSAPPLASSGQSATTYDPGTLANSTTYYWRIVAHDNHDHSTSGPVWSFTTVGGFAGMVLVPAGPYNIGATYQPEAQPVHAVNVPAFYMDIYEVTNAQYKAFCDSTSRTYPLDPGFPGMPNYFTDPAYANYPVVNVDWNDARAYAAWAGKRLPTEAEWERAAKGNTDNRQYPWGDTWVAANANIWNNPADGYTRTSPVGNYPNGISPAGCYDIAGNVWEWCEDDWHSNYNGAPTDGSAWIDSPRGSTRVIRGGSWEYGDTYTRCANRNSSSPTNRDAGVGFRCARTP